MIIVPGVIAAVVASLVLVFFFKRKITYWEAVLPIPVGLVIALLCNLAVTTSLTRDTEFHGGWFIKSEYYEGWTEEYEVTVTDYCTRTNSKGQSETYACGSHQEKRTTYHPAYWQTTDSNGYEIGISSDKFERECQKHGSRVFKDIYHSGQISIGDGNMYYTTWNGQESTFEPITVAKSYENKVQASHSVFNFQEVDKDEIADYHLVEYPAIQDYYHMDSVIGPDIPGMHRANQKLNIANAKLGRSKQVRMFLLVWQDQPVEAASLQESLWKGGNKNEFVVCVGIDKDRKVKWSYVFSWTEVDQVKFEVRNKAAEQGKFDPVALVDYMVPEVQKQFVRKPFEEFSYLKVEPPFWGQVVSFVIALAVQIGLGVYLVQNQFDEDNDPLKIGG